MAEKRKPVERTDSTETKKFKDDSEDFDIDQDDFAEENEEEKRIAGTGLAEDSQGSGSLKYAEYHKKWKRPDPVQRLDEDLIFQEVEVEYHVTDIAPKSFASLQMAGCIQPPMPVIRIFGVNEIGNSICCNVYGYTPYLYIQAPAGFTEHDCGEFRKQLNEKMKQRISPATAHKPDQHKDYIVGVKIVYKRSLKGYIGKENVPFLQIFCSLPKQVPICRGILESDNFWDKHLHPTYESDILFVLRYMVDAEMTGFSWLKLEKGTYTFTAPEDKVSAQQIEVDCCYADVVVLGYEDEWSKIAPIRILSFDIECMNRKGIFPEPEHDAVITIANQCSRIAGADVLSFDSEKDFLDEWSRFVKISDPDIITGYNVANFDIPYLLNRAARLKVRKFGSFSRTPSLSVKTKDSTFSSRAFGTRESKEIICSGRIMFDMLQVIQRDYKLRSFTLNFVSANFLGDQKEEVHYSAIAGLFNGSDDDRRRLAVYCLKDAWLPQQLMDFLMSLINYIEMSRVTGVPFSYLLPRGQQIKVISQLYREANKVDMVVPFYHRQATKAAADEKYKGAVVIEPSKGFYNVPIATLDFNSLYPSIMIAHNICYSTLVSRATIERLGLKKDVDYEETPEHCFFVKESVQHGILPLILKNLLASRKKAKADLAKETDPAKKAVLDGRQLALKVSANSVYGFTGAQVGKLPCTEIASSVTSFGREMINLTRDIVESEYSVANGYHHDVKVIYGDTDSVMVNFHEMDMKRVMELGVEAAAKVTSHFIKPINLEFEKAYFPYLLISKKRYAGMYWVKPDKPLKMDMKGIESVRRDNCPLVKHVVNTCLDKILRERNVKSAEAFVKQIISDLLRNKLDLSLLVISKALSKEGKQYAAKQAHVELAKKMRERDSATAPNIGDRVPYVIVQSGKDARAYEKAEDPLYALEKSLPLDYEYYIEQQLRKPISRIFKPILGDVSELFHGEHTRTLSVTMPSAASGGIMSFAKKTLRCLGCRIPISGNHALCQDCQDRTVEIYRRQLGIVNRIEENFDRINTQCQRCMGSLHRDILCSNRDCPIFYIRSKVRRDLKEAQNVLDKFDIEDCCDACK